MAESKCPNPENAQARWMTPKDYAAWKRAEFATIGREPTPSSTERLVEDLARFAGYDTLIRTDAAFGMHARFRFLTGNAVIEGGDASDALAWATAQARSMRLSIEAARIEAEELRRSI